MKIVLIDDHHLIRAGLRNVLENNSHTVIAEAASIAQGRLILATTKPDLVIVDLSLPDGSGLELIQPDLPFLVLTLGEEATSLQSARDRGAVAYILKSEPLDHLLMVITQIAAGKRPLKEPLHTFHQSAAERFAITTRELEVLTVLALGWSTREIASHLFLAEATVKSHLAAINRKLHSTSRTMAIARAREEGLLAR
jgi:DNA-binding NarL/FixJ family response regulator